MYLGKINPFRIAEPSDVRMFDELKRFEVACVTPSDDVFKAPRAKKKRGKEVNESLPENAQPSKAVDLSEKIFDKNAREIYKRIPESGACSIDALVGEGEDIRTVMKALLTLDMSNFIDMLPGEQVKRKEN